VIALGSCDSHARLMQRMLWSLALVARRRFRQISETRQLSSQLLIAMRQQLAWTLPLLFSLLRSCRRVTHPSCCALLWIARGHQKDILFAEVVLLKQRIGMFHVLLFILFDVSNLTCLAAPPHTD